MQILRVFMLSTTVLAACGCTGNLLRSDSQPRQTYILRALPATSSATANADSLRPTLQISRPQAGPGLDSDHIALLQSDRRLNYYAASRWPDELTETVEALAVEVLRGSGTWASVNGSRGFFAAEYLLQIYIRHFEADYTTATARESSPVARVVLDCSLGRRDDRSVVASFTAAGEAPAAANRLGAVVAAFEQAANEALMQVAVQVGEAARIKVTAADVP